MNIKIIKFDQLDDPAQQQLLDEACRNDGFFALENHGIDRTVKQVFFAEIAQYFAQPTTIKRQNERTQDNPFGFYDRELTKNKLDQKEIFDISLATSESTPWPRNERFIAATSAWHASCHKIALRLLDVIDQCLQTGEQTKDIESLAEHFSNHTSFLRLNFYPKLTVDKNGTEPTFGVSHHTDAGALTILSQDHVESLQFYVADQWHTVAASPNQLLVNLGDMLQVWSNDRYQAPLHRVLTNSDSDRYSAPYFLNPNNTSNISPLVVNEPRYRTVNWREFRHGRASGDYADQGHEIQISDFQINA